MDPSGIAQIALEVCDLLQLQLDSIVGRKFTDFTPAEVNAYEKRKSRIAELRSELHHLANAAPRTATRGLKLTSDCHAER